MPKFNVVSKMASNKTDSRDNKDQLSSISLSNNKQEKNDKIAFIKVNNDLPEGIGELNVSRRKRRYLMQEIAYDSDKIMLKNSNNNKLNEDLIKNNQGFINLGENETDKERNKLDTDSIIN